MSLFMAATPSNMQGPVEVQAQGAGAGAELQTHLNLVCAEFVFAL